MFFSIRHVTRFRYSAPVHESVMELRMQPRSEGPQRLRSFQIITTPRAQLYAYTDHNGNQVYHFNVLRQHGELRVEAIATVEVAHFEPLDRPADDLEWSRYNRYNLSDDHYDLLQPSDFARPSEALSAFLTERELAAPKSDPFSALKSLNAAIYDAFDYEVGITDVHSPIDHALAEGRGVCQDFAHLMIAAARSWGIPARYVSGYLFHRRAEHERSSPDASHAWMEAYLPSFGWVGFDPTNNSLAGPRHIRACIGRDYNDVPPTRGTFKGDAESELAIAVSVIPAQAPTRTDDFLHVARTLKSPIEKAPVPDRLFHQQQQQQ
jgi:transglutaminase-like putative cysteine protease